MTELAAHDESRIAHELVCVCCNCKRERTSPDEWRVHVPQAGEQLTHGICVVCLYELYPDVAPLVRPRE